MITDETARRLVKSLRAIAEYNEGCSKESQSDWWVSYFHGKADAYNLSAEWLEEQIADGET